MISTILFVLAGFFVILFATWTTQGNAMLRTGKYQKVTIPMWPLLLATIFVIVGILL